MGKLGWRRTRCGWQQGKHLGQAGTTTENIVLSAFLINNETQRGYYNESHLLHEYICSRLAVVGRADTDGVMPGSGFWALPDAELHCSAPWNGGAFRTARDQLFIAAVRLHRAFIIAAARTVKPSLNTIARAAQGEPDAPRPTAADWGVFFLLVPVVSTTFASIGRMFPGVAAGEIG